MSLLTASSPHSSQKKDTGHLMRHVMYATVPALLVSTWAFGFGTLVNVIWCMLLAALLEAGCLKLRQKPIRFFLNDYSAMLTGLLLGLSIPPFAPWWLSLIGMVFAIPIAKHLYGGLGSNPFNPAMIGYAILLVSFPVEMTRWASANEPVSPYSTWLMFTGQAPLIDQLTGATPLDSFKTTALHGTTDNTFYSHWLYLESWVAINIAYLLGGLYLLYRRIISWHIPVSLLAAIGLLSSVFFCWDNSHYASPLIHLLSGATMIGAFFIATDPVTAVTSKPGRLIYGAGIGILVYIIRTWGGYPDAIAFAVLLMNLAAPTIDHLLQPRTFGHDIKPVTWRTKKVEKSQ
jgi:electron transport complex protein RnfD